jgi:glutamine kinase
MSSHEKSQSTIFSSKSNVLKYLQKKISKSKIEKIYTFTISDWETNEEIILNKILQKFKKKLIVVRSSAFGEDSIEFSQAGLYDSVLNVDTNFRTSVKKSILKVINSYTKNKNYNPNNQILVQTQTQNVLRSGVIFSRSLSNGAPYYIINYEIGNSTDGVTKGKINNTIKIFRKTPSNRLPKEWKKLIASVKELEFCVSNDSLDIEFGITKKNVVIFQVRPLVGFFGLNFNHIENQIKQLIDDSKKHFSYLKKTNKKFGHVIAFSDMADWNPSEIIGTDPNVLDYSLYDYLIMKDSWSKGRFVLGYQDLTQYPLMTKFGNKPYVDIRASFNSMIPSILSNSLKKKLYKYYFSKLQKFPYLHDKVEFEILFTCYDLTLDSKFHEFKEFGFTKNDISELKHSLLIFTNDIINNFEKYYFESQASIQQLTKKRIKILSNLKNKNNLKELQKTIKIILNDCKQFGTINFSSMARIAFISSVLLHSLTSEISSKQVDQFMHTISTPLIEIQDDTYKLKKGIISKEDFLKKYGHLRPGTYDITVSRYDHDPEFFQKIEFIKSSKKYKKYKFPIIKTIDSLKFKNSDLLTFAKTSLSQRETLKFEFSKSLSELLELIAEMGKQLGFTRNEIANLDIEDILNMPDWDIEKIKKNWKHKIIKECERKNLSAHLVLPPLIFSKTDFEVITHYISKPNFITDKKVQSKILSLDKEIDGVPKIKGKIVLIESADPGFDWIFTKSPLGLITKYGGVASHMAIRCAELGLPAAIGCGDVLYEQLLSSSIISLNCKDKEIFILKNKIEDEFIKEKKILKSLGYIR